MVLHFKEQFSSSTKTPGVDIHSVLLGFLMPHILVFQTEHVLETESDSILRWQSGEVPTTLLSVLVLGLHG